MRYFENEAKAAFFMVARMNHLVHDKGFRHSDGRDYEKNGGEVLLERDEGGGDVLQVVLNLIQNKRGAWSVDEMSRTIEVEEAVLS